MIFEDRVDAGRRLAEKLKKYAGRDDVVVLALPRGGVVLGYEIARALHAPLDVVVARKIGMPGDEEFAIGAVTEEGEPVWNKQALGLTAASDQEELVEKKRAEVRERLDKYRAGRSAVSIKGKIVLVVDDGVATGQTAEAALRSVRARSPQKIVLAVPHGVRDSLKTLSKFADELVHFSTPPFYRAVSQSYRDFPQVEDDEVVRLLKEANNQLLKEANSL